MLKQGGRGNEPTGADGMSTGELSILCPSFPRPDINLEEGWDSVPLALQYVDSRKTHFADYLPNGRHRYLYTGVQKECTSRDFCAPLI